MLNGALALGPIHDRPHVAWIGWTLARPAILHLTGTHLLFRLILSEQPAKAPRVFPGLGVASARMVTPSGVMAPAASARGNAPVAARHPRTADGILGQGAGHAGQRVTPGTALVPHGGADLCVMADFHATAMAGLQPGRAGGCNVAKIAQRLPVRILIDPGQDRAGLHVGGGGVEGG